VRLGSVLSCEARDCDVIVAGYSDGRIPWPLGRRHGSGVRGFVLFGDLARAIRQESNQAVCHWWGVTEKVVTKWRKALGVGANNTGTARLRTEYAKEDWFVAGRRKAISRAGNPERRRKLSEVFRGKPRPPHVVEALRRASTGRKVSARTRAKLAAAMHKRAKSFIPNGRIWTAKEDELIRTRPAPQVARRTGRTIRSVYQRRARLNVPDGRTTQGPRARRLNRQM